MGRRMMAWSEAAARSLLALDERKTASPILGEANRTGEAAASREGLQP